MNKLPIRAILAAATMLLVVLCTADLFARAGGGGGSGKGTGGILALIIWGIYTVIISVLLFIKTTRSRYILHRAFKHDTMWDHHKMKAQAKDLFFKMQQAWMNHDIDSMKEFITPELYSDYKQQLDIMRSNNHKNILEFIHVSTIKIISCEDFNDNSKDTFIAYIKGTMLDYTINEKTGFILKNEEREEESFSDTYHFVRQSDRWLINYIDNDVTISDIIAANNYRETPPIQSTAAQVNS